MPNGNAFSFTHSGVEKKEKSFNSIPSPLREQTVCVEENCCSEDEEKYKINFRAFPLGIHGFGRGTSRGEERNEIGKVFLIEKLWFNKLGFHGMLNQ